MLNMDAIWLMSEWGVRLILIKRKNCSETALNCSETALKPLWNRSETALKLPYKLLKKLPYKLLKKLL